MTAAGGSTSLAPAQQALLEGWMPGWACLRDRSWGLTPTVVLEALTASGERRIVKAAPPEDRHLAREIRAHERWIAPWAQTGHASHLLHANLAAGLLVTTFVPGRLVLGSPAERDVEVFAQAGALLARLHVQETQYDRTWWDRARTAALQRLEQPHRIPSGIARALRAEITAWPAAGAAVVPTHGDWHPRNWLVDDDGTVRAIDFGRTDLRPVLEDFTRLTARDFVGAPALKAAFLAGYGSDPRTEDPAAWRRAELLEALGTAVWAHAVGDTAFEAHGLRWLERNAAERG